MKRLIHLLVLFTIGLCTQQTLAHVSWHSVNGVSCPTLYSCRSSAIELEAGSSITVEYNVIIQHGGPIQVDISGLSSSAAKVLESSLPETSGLNTTSITLPKEECQNCTLTVRGSGYSGSASIRLVKKAHVPGIGSLAEVEGLLSMAEDSQIHLMWTNPVSDFSKVLVLQSNDQIVSGPMNGSIYGLGDSIGGSEVLYIGEEDQWTTVNLERGTDYYFKLYTLDDDLNYSSGVGHEASTTDVGNNPPWIDLVSTQGGNSTTAVMKNGGEVGVLLSIQDADQSDMHVVDWSGSDKRLVNISDDSSMFVFDPSQLSAGQYQLKVGVIDDGEPSLRAQKELMITVLDHHNHVPEPVNTAKKNGGSFDLFSILFSFGAICIFFFRRKNLT